MLENAFEYVSQQNVRDENAVFTQQQQQCDQINVETWTMGIN